MNLSITPADCSSTFRGNLSITLESAVTVNFTTSQLLLNGDPYLDSTGMVNRNLSATNVPIVIMFAGDTNMPRLGGMFFNPAYLMVNHDKNEFSIAAAQTPPAVPDIVGIDTALDCVAWLNGTVLLSKSSAPEQDISTLGPDKFTTGTIVGISIGAVTGFAFIAAASFFCWQRRRSSLPEASGGGTTNEALVAEKDHVEIFEAFAGPPVFEAGSNVEQSTAELDGDNRPIELY